MTIRTQVMCSEALPITVYIATPESSVQLTDDVAQAALTRGHAFDPLSVAKAVPLRTLSDGPRQGTGPTPPVRRLRVSIMRIDWSAVGSPDRWRLPLGQMPSTHHGRLPPQAPVAPGELENTGWNLVGAALQMVARLRDHIERFDAGQAYAVDDLAVVLRGLLCSGNGNRVLMRLAQSADISVPSVRVSRPAPAEEDVFFAVGSIPVGEPGAMADGAAEVSLTKWMSLRVLTVQSAGSRATYSWDRFLSIYAMKWGGAHLDPAVPAHLQMIDGHAAGGLPLSNYLLRAAGVAAWEIAQQMFREIFADTSVLSDAETKQRVTMADARQRGAAFFSAPGGLTTVPRDIGSRGLLQVFAHRSSQAELLWYVDPASAENTLHLRLGTVPYDVRYGNACVPAAEGTVPLQAQRQPNRPEVIEVAPGSLKTIPVDGTVLTLDQVRERIQAEPD
jgi:hypothetical protein